MDGLVVIGEGERDEAPMLYIGEKVGSGTGQRIDIALDPLEGTTLCAKAMPNAIACVAMAEAAACCMRPTTYMDKIAIGGGYPDGVVDLDLPPAENIRRLAKAKGVAPREITACILDRPRHEALIQAVRETGASIRLITDGDVAGVIHTATPDETGIDIYMGIGGAPEGVLAAAALRCIGGQMQGRLVHQERGAEGAGAQNGDRGFQQEVRDERDGQGRCDVRGDRRHRPARCCEGVHFEPGYVTTETVVMRSATGTVRWIRNRRPLAQP